MYPVNLLKSLINSSRFFWRFLRNLLVDGMWFKNKDRFTFSFLTLFVDLFTYFQYNALAMIIWCFSFVPLLWIILISKWLNHFSIPEIKSIRYIVFWTCDWICYTLLWIGSMSIRNIDLYFFMERHFLLSIAVHTCQSI